MVTSCPRMRSRSTNRNLLAEFLVTLKPALIAGFFVGTPARAQRLDRAASPRGKAQFAW